MAANETKTVPSIQDQSKCTFFVMKKKAKRGRPKLVKIRYEASALGILLKHEIITLGMYQAAQQFAEWRYSIFGSPFASASNLHNDKVDYSYREKGIDACSSTEKEALEKKYNNLVKKIKESNRLGLEEVMNVAIYDRLPGWFLRSYHRPSDKRRREVLLKSLKTLIAYFEKLENNNEIKQ